MKTVKSIADNLCANVAQVLVGKDDVVRRLLIALLCRGHVLIEDVPGVGKTTLAMTLAHSLDCSFRRIQFTPDVTASDITGYTAPNPQTGEMVFRPGAVMSQIVLADEINRTSPKTQSSLLEVMEERQVTVDGTTYVMPAPFIVLATQNPVDFVGTYPLPEAQLDRFFMRISLGYPTPREEEQILARSAAGDILPEQVEPVCTAKELLAMQSLLSEVRVSEEIRAYIASLAAQSRRSSALQLGISTRAAICLLRAAQACALINDRGYVLPEDVQELAQDVLAHRLVLSADARMRGLSPEKVLEGIISGTKVPVRRS